MKYVGVKTLDAGDIIQTLAGWTVIGEGSSRIPRRLPLCREKRDFRDKMAETSKAAHAMDQALGELSLTCDPKDAGRALYLVTAPPKEIRMEVIKQLGDNLSAVASNALIRSGDYPRQKGSLDVTVVLSELTNVRKITSYFTKAIDLISEMKAKRGLGYGDRKLGETFDSIPVLL
jgi:cell division GTPase FtsZ